MNQALHTISLLGALGAFSGPLLILIASPIIEGTICEHFVYPLSERGWEKLDFGKMADPSHLGTREELLRRRIRI